MIVGLVIFWSMNENDEPCMELNEIIYHISGEFWKKAYDGLLLKQKTYDPGQDVAVRQAISELRKNIRTLAKENGLKCNAFSHNEHFYMSLVPYPIYIGIECETGDFSVSAPHISTKHFTHSEYQAGIKWIQDYINIDIKPLTEKTEAVREKFYLNTKSAGIVSTSIKALCESILGKRSLKYKLQQNRLRSDLTVVAKNKTVYSVEIYHKPFASDSSILINLLNNLREENIEDVLRSSVVMNYDKEIQELVDEATAEEVFV